jgi:hypothetical protein
VIYPPEKATPREPADKSIAQWGAHPTDEGTTSILLMADNGQFLRLELSAEEAVSLARQLVEATRTSAAH